MSKKVLTIAIVGGLFSLNMYRKAVSLKMETDNLNSNSGKAVAVLDCVGNVVGYVQESPKALNDIGSEEVFGLLKSINKKDVGFEFEFLDQGRTEGGSNFLRAIITIDIKEKNKMVNGEMYKVMLVTSTMEGINRAQKTALRKEFDNNGLVEVTLVAEDFKGEERIVAYYETVSDNGRVAVAMQDDSLGDLTEVLAYVKKGENQRRQATVKSALGRNLVCVVKISDVEILKSNKDLNKEMKRIIKEDIVTKETLDKRINYALECKVPLIGIISILKTYRKYPDKIAIKIAIPETLFVDTQGLVPDSVAYINVGRNLMYEGDRGVGKNVLTETLSWLYNRPLFEFSMNSQHDNTAYIGGKVFDGGLNDSKEDELNFFTKMSNLLNKGGIKKWFTGKNDDTDEVMEVVKQLSSMISGKQLLKFEPSTIIESAMYGGILVLDEVNTALGHASIILHSLLDDRRRITVEGFKEVIAEPNFFAIGTMNKDYQSTFDLNEAFEDRFEKVVFESNASIAGIVRAKVPTVEKMVVATCDKLYKRLLQGVQDGNLDNKVLTVRGFVNVAKVVTYQNFDLERALNISVANKASDIEDREAIKEFISALV